MSAEIDNHRVQDRSKRHASVHSGMKIKHLPVHERRAAVQYVSISGSDSSRATVFRAVIWVRASLQTILAVALFGVAGLSVASSNGYSESISLAVNRWLQVQEPTGFLPYGYDFLQDAAAEPQGMSAENLTRQALAAAALADYYQLTGDQHVREAIQRYLRGFGEHSLPVGKSRMQTLVEMTRVLSIPIGRYKLQSGLLRLGLLYQASGPGKVLSPDSDYSNAYAGAVALALLTELRYAARSRDNSFVSLRRAWLEGLLGLRIPGGGFRESATSIHSNSYADGQAWLALAEYHRAFPQDRRVGEVLANVDTASMNAFEHKYRILMFHWGAMAAAARFADTTDVSLLGFVKSQAASFLDRVRNHPDNDNNCASVEALADVMGALRLAGETEDDLFKQASAWAAAEMRKARLLQIQPGQQELVFSNARIVAPRMRDFAGEFRAGIYLASTQVDYTGHCLSAMVKLTRHGLYLQ